MPEDAIVTRDLTKTFGHFPAVDGLSVGVGKGELFGLLGPNGAGKTTTVRMLCTLIEPTRGTANVVGYDTRKQAAEVRRQIGVVSDGVSLYKDLTIEENLKLLSTLYEIPRPKAEVRIRELMDMFAFREKANRLVGALSTGWAKKAMICAALLHSPQVLFLDEVTSGLDPQSAIALQDFTKKQCDQGVTVIWTTHYMSEPEKICDRVGIMFAGRLVQVGTPNELKHSVSELSMVEVETPDLSKAQLDKVKLKLKAMKHVCNVKYVDSKLQVSCERTETLAEEVAAALLDVGGRIRTINTKDPTLEEAFIALTGGEEEIDRFLESAGQKA
ncbi:MAG: ATP-binding cassette domain-containing protein [Candidatus Bathyarchaeia archaeon]|jgi:ABC-2 type transport system ATP-binding protein